MPGYDEILVGYRARDPRAVWADHYGGRCVSCGNTVYFNDSAADILRGRDANGYDHDATIVCDWCWQVDRPSIEAAMV